MLKNKNLQATLALVLVTAAWGLTFPVIKDSVKSIPPFTFVSIRFLIGALFLWVGGKKFTALEPTSPSQGTREWVAGIILGIVLFFGYSLQTIGLQYTSASNAGFITGLSVVLVPLIMVFSGNKIRWFTWVAITISTFGIALLSLTEKFSLGIGDLLVLGCSFVFALHIVLVSKFSTTYDPVRMTRIQIIVCAAISGCFAFFSEKDLLEVSIVNSNTVAALLFCGVIATALAYLIQNTFQKYSSPTATALIFTCEPVFSAIFSIWIASEFLSYQQYFGGFLLILAMVIGEFGPKLAKAEQSTSSSSR